MFTKPLPEFSKFFNCFIGDYHFPIFTKIIALPFCFIQFCKAFNPFVNVLVHTFLIHLNFTKQFITDFQAGQFLKTVSIQCFISPIAK